MPDEKSVQLQNNMDVHYLIQNEVAAQGNSVDLKHCLNSDSSFIGSLSGSSSKPSVLNPIQKVELSSLDSVFSLDDIPLFKNGDSITADEFSVLLSRLEWSYLRTLVSIPFQESVYTFMSKWASRSSSAIAEKIKEAERSLLHVLAEEASSVGLLYGIFDSLSDDGLINREESTVHFDLNSGIVFPEKLKAITVEDIHITQILEVSDLLLADYLDTNIVSPRHNKEKRKPFLVSRKVYVNDSQEKVLLDIIIRPEDVDFSKVSSFSMKLPSKNGIEKIRVTSKVKGSNSYLFNDINVGDNTIVGSIENPIENIEELKFSLISTVTDSLDNTGAYHLFLVESLILLEHSGKSSTGILKTKNLEFKKTDGAVYQFRNIFVETNGGKTTASNKLRILAEVYYPLTNRWSGKMPIKNSTSKLIVPSTDFSNISTRESQLVTPFEKGSSQCFAQVDFSISDATVPDMQYRSGIFSEVLDPDELIVIRGAGSKETYLHPTNSLFSESVDDGWLFVNNYYQTSVFITEGMQIEVDFGSSPILINGATVTGKFVFTAGLYTVSINRTSWASLEAGLTAKKFTSEDPLFPYNHKYLIQGYPSVPEYAGVSLFGEQVCSFVDPDYLMFNLYNGEEDRFELLSGTKYPPIFSLFSSTDGGNSTAVLIPIDSTYTRFNKEKVIIWGVKYKSQDFASKLRLTFELDSSLTILGSKEESVYLDSYTARVV